MRAVITKIRADIRRRKLQSLVIALVILLSSCAATLALSLQVESDAPYDHAFAQAQGAHLTMTYAADRVTAAQLRTTGSASHVIAALGPLPFADARLTSSDAAMGKGGGYGLGDIGAYVAGRTSPNTSVDKIVVESGRWVRGPGEIVISQQLADYTGLQVGNHLTAGAGNRQTALLIVGIAASISHDVDAWVEPQQVPALLVTPKGSVPLQYLMLYRVSPAASSADLRAAEQSITRHLPIGAVLNTSNYLDVKLNADRLTAVMIPFLLAFSVFALVAAALIIANVISGVVIASYREIGIMKAVGFTPSQVIQVLYGQILVPTLAGCLVGVPLGTLGSQPFLQDTAHALNLPTAFTAVIPVDLLVLGAVVAIALLAAIIPSWRAGHLSAVSAITMGSAPAVSRGAGITRWLSRLPLPRPLSLGFGDALARPLRSGMTMGAILIGVATVVFSLSLHLSLQQIAGHLIRDQYVQAEVDRASGGPMSKGGPPASDVQVISDAQVVSILRSDPGTARFTAETRDQVIVPGIAEPIPYFAYRGDSSWIGYALIQGRWFSRPGEVVAPTKLLNQAHLHVGESITARLGRQATPVHLRIVGEIFDQESDDLLLRGDWSTLATVAPGIQATFYEVALKPGVDPELYSRRVSSQSPQSLYARAAERSGENTSFLLLQGVIASLAVILTVISVAGVFNTVVLSTREKVRDVAILKAVGMAPGQVVAMVVASVAILGVAAGALGIPVGLALHQQILQTMGQIATGTAIPAHFFDLISHAALPLLALSGVAVAALGAWLPAQWAASSGVAEVLQSE